MAFGTLRLFKILIRLSLRHEPPNPVHKTRYDFLPPIYENRQASAPTTAKEDNKVATIEFKNDDMPERRILLKFAMSQVLGGFPK